MDDETKSRFERLENLMPQISIDLAVIKEKVAQPHTCKWENVIPVLVEFKNNADRRLDTHGSSIDKLTEEFAVANEMSKQNNDMLKILIKAREDDQKEKANDAKSSWNKLKDRGYELAKAVALILFGCLLPIIIATFK